MEVIRVFMTISLDFDFGSKPLPGLRDSVLPVGTQQELLSVTDKRDVGGNSGSLISDFSEKGRSASSLFSIPSRARMAPSRPRSSLAETYCMG
jgi:hypothetical protein